MSIRVATETNDLSAKPFPKLMISKVHGFILLMTDKTTGAVIYSPNGLHKIGFVSKLWEDSELIDYNHAITLQND